MLWNWLEVKENMHTQKVRHTYKNEREKKTKLNLRIQIIIKTGHCSR